MAAIIGISFAIILGLNLAKRKYAHLTGHYFEKYSYYFGLLITLVVWVINYFLFLAIEWITTCERHWTYAKFFRNKRHKLSYVLFINSALTIFIVNYYLKTISTRNGLIEQIFYLLFYSLFTPFYNFYNPWHFLKKYHRYKYEKQSKDKIKPPLNKKEVFEAFEGTSCDIAWWYASVINIMNIAVFFQSLLPIGVPIAFIYLFLFYWVEKYRLLRRYKIPI